MIDAPTWLEWPLLIAAILVVCFVAFALTAHRVGGWRQLQMQLTSPELPMRYLVLIIPATVGATVLIDPLDSVSGTGWIWEVLFPLGLYAGLVWSFTRRFRHLRSASGGERGSFAAERAHQRGLAWTSIAGSLVLVVIGIVVLGEGNFARFPVESLPPSLAAVSRYRGRKLCSRLELSTTVAGQPQES